MTELTETQQKRLEEMCNSQDLDDFYLGVGIIEGLINRGYVKSEKFNHALKFAWVWAEINLGKLDKS